MSLRKRLLVKPPSSGVTPSKNFKAVIYTGNGGTQAITGVGFKPDFVWIKCRSTSHSHFAADSTRGANKYLMPNETSAELTRSDQIQSFDTDGFTLAGNGDVNGSGKTYVAWCLKAGEGTTSSNTDGSITSTVQANQDAGFSIVTWTGDGNVSTLGHGLSKVPEMVIAKGRANLATYNRWTTYHHSLSENHLVYLDLSDAEGNAGADKYFDDSAFSNTVFGVGDDAYGPNVNGTTMVAYCFHSVDNFSKFDLYTGNGSANGPIVETGFEPAFLIVKGKSNSGSWLIFDNKRNTTNPRTKILYADSGTTETTNSNIKVDFLSNGFQLTGTDTDYNGSGRTYIYMAFAADPDTEAPTLANSFDIQTYNMTGGSDYDLSFAFKPQFVVTKTRDEAAHWSWGDIIRGNNSNLSSNDSNAVSTTNQWRVKDWYAGATSVTIAQHASTNTSNVSYAWKADDNEATIEEVTEDADAVAIYELNQNADDALGNYDGTVTGTANWTSSGKFNYAAQFDSWHINTGHNFSLANNSFSISFWFANSATGSTNSYVISTDSAESTNNKLLIGRRDSNGKLNFAFYANDLSSATDVTTDGTWQHWVCTYNASTNSRKIYLNGSLDASDTASADYQGTGNLEIGFGIYQGLGKVDQVRIYNKELNSASVTNLYNETTSQTSTANIGTKTTISIQSIVSANANAGFSIVKWEGDGVATSRVPHGLSAKPDMVIIKDLTEAGAWNVAHVGLASNEGISLNSTAAAFTSMGNNGGITYANLSATTFGFATGAVGVDSVNKNGNEYIAYCFHSVSSYSKIGSYSGTGSEQLITTGFAVDFVLIKASSTTQSWMIYDSVRSGTNYIEVNSSAAEGTAGSNLVSFESNGFKVYTSNSENQNGQTYIYMAIKIN